MSLLVVLLGCARRGSDASPWRPGDPIPGWEDTDCEEETASYVLDAFYPFQSMDITFSPGQSLFALAEIRGVFADCHLVDCDDYNHGGMWLEYSLLAGAAPGAGPRGQGFYPMAGSDAESRAVTGYAATFFGRFFDATQGSWYNADVTACISHLSPDHVSGYIRWAPWGSASARDAAYGFHTLIWRQRFNLRVPPPGGMPGDESVQEYHSGQPREAEVRFDYTTVPYDEAWPWSAISDATLRDHIREMYRPR